MRLFVVSAILVGANAALAAPPGPKLPYRAQVHTEEAVRSGPGTKFYATGALGPGEIVTVRRHDPGGWFMIDPPQGSFSWIRADFVERIDHHTGSVVGKQRVPVYVGSEAVESRNVCQRYLSEGDEIRILHERTLAGNEGPERWLQIAPPPLEYRWINGQCLAPPQPQEVLAGGHAQHASDPRRQPNAEVFGDEAFEIVESEPPRGGHNGSANETRQERNAALAEQLFGEANVPPRQTGRPPQKLEQPQPIHDHQRPQGAPHRVEHAAKSTHIREVAPQNRPSRNADAESPKGGAAIAQGGPAADELAHHRARLAACNERLKEILAQEVPTWDFTEIEQAYIALHNETKSVPLQRQTELKLVKIAECRDVQLGFVEFLRITGETSRRDSQLTTGGPSPAQRQMLQRQPQVDAQRQAAWRAPAPVSPQLQPQQPKPASAQSAVQPALAQPSLTEPLPIRQVATPRPLADSPGMPPAVPGAMPQPQQPTSSRFDGVGIVRRSPPNVAGGPRYVLAGTDGRILAYLHFEQGGNLEPYVGQSIGVNGQRNFHPGLRGDLIVVRNVSPVRLAQ